MLFAQTACLQIQAAKLGLNSKLQEQGMVSRKIETALFDCSAVKSLTALLQQPGHLAIVVAHWQLCKQSLQVLVVLFQGTDHQLVLLKCPSAVPCVSQTLSEHYARARLHDLQKQTSYEAAPHSEPAERLPLGSFLVLRTPAELATIWITLCDRPGQKFVAGKAAIWYMMLASKR